MHMMSAITASSSRSRRRHGTAALFALLLALPGTALAWWNGEWSFRKEISITAPADLPAGTALTNVPVLIRLHDGVLAFQDVKPDGSDIRFTTGDDKTPLKYHIEKFDAVFNMGFVWVQIPQLAAGTPVKIWMYYGNPDVGSGDEAAATFDSGQTLVYHLSEVGAPAVDASSYKNNATATFTSVEGGLVGGAAAFNGQSVLALPASASLNVAAGGTLTVSMWVKPAAAGSSGVLYSQRDVTGSLELGLAGGAPYVEISNDIGEVLRSDPAAALPDTEWHHVALVATAEAVTLFVDGVAGPVLQSALPALASAAVAGGRVDIPGGPVVQGFTGEIDELQLAKVARDAGFLSVVAGNQGPSDQMVQFGVDEGQSHSGYIGIILSSLTFDGWAVIVICIIMMVISWYVMWIKARQSSRVTASNAIFMQLFRESAGDFLALDRSTAKDAKTGKLAAKDRLLLQTSPLLHIFRDGVEEMRQRLSVDNHGMLKGYLSPQSIEAIRATIDSRLVREVQSLGSLLVLLTIAISGGPFIGLLGTVVGVMITFAGVAAAGDVNINAIAPGISAALAATVTGLFVAIPSLFGYNYLITRNKETTAQMQVFVDTLVTRMAENYSDPTAAH
jgi:biopolymer transport protein ExbB